MKQSINFLSTNGQKITYEVSDRADGIVSIKIGNSTLTTDFTYNDFFLMTENVRSIIRSQK